MSSWSPTARRSPLTTQAAAASDANGNATFTFNAPPSGIAWTGTVTVDQAPPGVQLTANLAGIPWGSAGGSITVQAPEGQQVVVTATGLAPQTSYRAVWIGTASPMDQTPWLAPTAVTPPTLAYRTLFNQTVPFLAAGAKFLPIVSVGQFQSLGFSILNFSGDAVALTVNWLSSPAGGQGTQLASSIYQSAADGLIQDTLPVLGPYAQLQIGASGPVFPSNVIVVVFGLASLQLPGSGLFSSILPAAINLNQTGPKAIAAGASLTTLNSWTQAGPATLTVVSSGKLWTAQVVDATGGDYGPPGPPFAALDGGGAKFGDSTQFFLPSSACEMTITNNDTVPRNFSWTVTVGR